MRNSMLRELRPLCWLVAVHHLVAVMATTADAAPGPCAVDPGLPNPIYIELQTSMGAIAVELWPDVAPCTVNNFLAYMESGRYDGSFIHRTVDNFVIQGGGYAYDSGTDSFESIVRDPAVVNEPGESNLRATIAMARMGGQVNSATSEFFINLTDNSFLDTVDEGFTVFGVVAETSMNVVDDIATLSRVEGRWTLNSALRETFGELPVLAAPTDPPGGFGCFDPFALPDTGLGGWIRALIDVTGNFLEPDPLTGALYYLSNSCDGSGATAPPSVPCSTDRDVAYLNVLVNQWQLDPTPMTCERVAESEESLAARRDFQHPQVTDKLVEVTTIYMPEPTGGVLLLWALGSVCALAWRRV
jgi:cyclophilin family peptidyl-prolyl cis-trans isomerase